MAKPISTLKYKTIQVAVFENDTQNGKFNTCCITTSYKNNSGEWIRQTVNISMENATVLATMLEHVFMDTAIKTKKNEPEQEKQNEYSYDDADDIPF